MPEPILFYGTEFYCLSNFSAFRLYWGGLDFDTSEAAFQWEKFHHRHDIQQAILNARSAHSAYRIAQNYKDDVQPNWNERKIPLMREILLEKVMQHEYVLRKLRQTEHRPIIEDSHRDSFWGWGPDKNGHNHLGKLWESIRTEWFYPPDLVL